MTVTATLTPFQQRMLLSVCLQDSTIVAAHYFREQYLPCPVRVNISTADGTSRSLVLRVTRHGDVGHEARLLPLLAKAGLPVPSVLAGPAADSDTPGCPSVAVYSLLPGITLQHLSQRSAQDCRLARDLVLDGARRLASLTPALRADPRAAFLPTITLRDQLQAVLARGDSWLSEPAFRRTAERLDRVLNDVPNEPVFTNGDYQPGNFLTDGTGVTGFIDFELAGYRDFLFGFAKYPIYDIHPLNKGGMVQHLLDQERIAPRDFDIRLVLGCLMTLQREIPVRDGDADYRDHVLSLLDRACSSL